jgi:hypothetical protein
MPAAQPAPGQHTLGAKRGQIHFRAGIDAGEKAWWARHSEVGSPGNARVLAPRAQEKSGPGIARRAAAGAFEVG